MGTVRIIQGLQKLHFSTVHSKATHTHLCIQLVFLLCTEEVHLKMMAIYRLACVAQDLIYNPLVWTTCETDYILQSCEQGGKKNLFIVDILIAIYSSSLAHSMSAVDPLPGIADLWKASVNCAGVWPDELHYKSFAFLFTPLCCSC